MYGSRWKEGRNGTYPIPSGELDHGITGSGLYIESEKAGFSSMPPLCNYKVAYVHKNVDGVEYERAESELISDGGGGEPAAPEPPRPQHSWI